MIFERGCGLAYFNYNSRNSSCISLEGLGEREYCSVYQVRQRQRENKSLYLSRKVGVLQLCSYCLAVCK